MNNILILFIPFLLLPSWITIFGARNRRLLVVAANVGLVICAGVSVALLLDFRLGVDRAVVRIASLGFGVVPVVLITWLVILGWAIRMGRGEAYESSSFEISPNTKIAQDAEHTGNSVEKGPYAAPRTLENTRAHQVVAKAKQRAVFATVAVWIMPLALLVPASLSIFLIVLFWYGVVLFVLAMALSERYLETAKKNNFQNHLPLAYGLFGLNSLPIIFGLLSLIYQVLWMLIK